MNMNFTDEELKILRYGLALINEETCNKISNTPNKANNIKLLKRYKEHLINVNKIDDKLKAR